MRFVFASVFSLLLASSAMAEPRGFTVNDLVNLDRVTEIKPSPHGDFQVHLQNGQVLRLSRAYRDQLLP